MAFKPRKDECGFLACMDPREEDSYMCPVHRAVLKPVRDAMAAEEDPYGTRSGKSKSAPQCTRPGCRNPRKSGASMCADCAEEAFWEGEQED
jgi:hypothetical protein